MSAALAACLASLGFTGAFIAGLLGIGGAIIMIPLLLYLPGWLGLGNLDMQAVAALSMAQVFFAALSGALAHGVRGSVHRDLAITAGISAAVGSLVGGIGSRWVPSWGLLLTFAVMATMGAALLWVSPPEGEGAGVSKAGEMRLPRPPAIAVGLGVGLMAGLVGAGGAFLLVPLLIVVLRVPTRVTIGSSLAITVWTAAAGLLGKIATGQVAWALAAPLVLGAVPGAQMGEWVGRRFRIRTLRGLLTALIALVAARVWVDVLTGIR